MLADRYCPTCLSSFAEDLPRCSNLACRRRRPTAGWARLLAAGNTIDRYYEVQEVLAVGGAGVTYRARELDADDIPQLPDLAIKVLHFTRSSGAFLQRLANEAQILQGLQHDHIVECLGFVQRRGTAPYLVTRFERGGTLQDLVEEHGPLPPWTVAGILRQVFEALAMAHQRGVVHRDLKPANVLLREKTARTEIPHVRVADFGIAKVSGGPGAGLTRAGYFIGTPQYAAPEQFLGQPATPEADVFAAAALGMYLLTGEPHFEPPDDGDMSSYHQAVLDSVPPELPRRLVRSRKGALLQRLLVGTMQGKPDQRWPVSRCIGWLDYVLDVRTQPPVKQSETEDGPDTSDATPARSRGPEREEAPRQPQLSARARLAVATTAGESTPTGPIALSTLIANEPPPSPPPSPPSESRPRLRSPRRPTRPPPVQRPPPSDRSTDPGARTAIRGRKAAWRAHADADSDVVLDDLGATGAPAPPSAEAVVEVGFERGPAGPFRVSYRERPPWQADPPTLLPTHLPRAAEALFCLLGSVSPDHRRDVMNGLSRVPTNRLHRLITHHGPGEDAAVGRGICVFLYIDPRDGYEAAVRSLLSDSDTGVRCLAALALAKLNPAGSIKTVGALMSDRSSQVRICALRAVVDAATQAGKGAVAAYLVKPRCHDGDAAVQAAAELALMDLGHG